MERKVQKRTFFHWPDFVNDEMLQKIRDTLIGSLVAGAVISRKMVIVITITILLLHTLLFY